MMARTYPGHAGGQWRPPVTRGLVFAASCTHLASGLLPDESGNGNHLSPYDYQVPSPPASVSADGLQLIRGRTMRRQFGVPADAPVTIAMYVHQIANPGGLLGMFGDPTTPFTGLGLLLPYTASLALIYYINKGSKNLGIIPTAGRYMAVADGEKMTVRYANKTGTLNRDTTIAYPDSWLVLGNFHYSYRDRASAVIRSVCMWSDVLTDDEQASVWEWLT